MAEHFIRSIEFWTVSCKTRQPRQPQRAAHGAGRWRSAPRTAPVDSAAARAPPTQPAAAAPHSAGRWRSAPRTAPVDGAAARAPPTQPAAARRARRRSTHSRSRRARRRSMAPRAPHGRCLSGCQSCKTRQPRQPPRGPARRRLMAQRAPHGAGRWRSGLGTEDSDSNPIFLTGARG
jgi:hypothetical protein